MHKKRSVLKTFSLRFLSVKYNFFLSFEISPEHVFVHLWLNFLSCFWTAFMNIVMVKTSWPALITLWLSITSCKTCDTHTCSTVSYLLWCSSFFFFKRNIVWFSADVRSEVTLNRMRCHTLGILFLSKNTFKMLKYKFNLLSCNTTNCSAL